MKTMKKRGFTLVELLVVIAILAILATVSVVGYTSFIERANVSNDQTLASQLNSMLTYMKSDSNGDFYNAEINENNIREVTKKVLADGGLDSLIPQSLEHGYNFYFDLQEQEYVVMKDKDVQSSAMNIILNAYAEDPKYEVKLENSFTQGNRYFLVGTYNENSVLSQIVDAFYAFNAETDYETLKSMVDNSGFAGLIDFVANSVIVTNDANYRLTSTPKHVIFVDGVVQVGTVTKQWDGTGFAAVDAGADYVLVTMENGTLTIPNSIKYLAEDSLNVAGTTIVINKPASVVAKMAQSNFSNGAAIKLTDGTYYTDDNGKLAGNESKAVLTDSTTAPTVELPLEYTNNLVDFGANLSGDANKYDNDSLTGGYIAWEKGTTVTIGATNFVGEDSSTPATGTAGITWAPKTDADARFVSVVDDKIVLNLDAATAANEVPSTLVLEGTAANGLKKDYTLTVVYLTGVDYKIDDVSVTEKAATGMTLLYGDDGKTSFAVTQTLGNLNITGTDIQIVPEVSLTHSDFTLADGSLTISDDKLTGEFTLKFETEGYSFLDKTITVNLFNVNSLAFSSDHADHVYVGDDNAITLGDLFKHNTGMTIPANAKVYIFTQTGDTPFAIDKDSLSPSSYAKDANYLYNINSSDWASTPVEFRNGSDDFATTTHKAVVTLLYEDENGDYIRIADNHALTVINAKNVKSYGEIDGAVNNILYSDIVMSATDPILTISSGKTLYGSGHTMDMRGYKDEGTPFQVDGEDSFHFIGLNKDVPYAKTDEALITLKGATLNNVKIVGEAYKSSDFMYQDHTNFGYGASLVKAEGGSYIVNSYLANTRSPLRVTGTVTVEDTVVFGGSYANIDVMATKNTSDKLVAGELILKGTVTTINQIIEGETDNSLGVGIVVDLFAHKDTKITIESKNTLVQYNFVEKSQTTNLPIVTYTMDLGDSIGKEDVNVFLSQEINKVFTESVYASWVHEQGDSKYFGSGVIFLNAMQFDCQGSGFLGGIAAGVVEGILKGLFGDASGDGSKISNLPDGYAKSGTVVNRNTTKSGVTINLDANVYIYAPQNTVTFNNTVPAEYLPSNVLAD